MISSSNAEIVLPPPKEICLSFLWPMAEGLGCQYSDPESLSSFVLLQKNNYVGPTLSSQLWTQWDLCSVLSDEIVRKTWSFQEEGPTITK